MSRRNILYFIIAAGLCLLTGATSFMPSGVYSSVWWSLLCAGIFFAIVLSIVMTHLWRNLPVFLLHISFLFMIAGGFCTALLSERGTLYLKPEKPCKTFYTDDGRIGELPFEVKLISFTPEYYHGMQVPKDFRSEVAVINGFADTMHISMNHIGRVDNYRFYQNSFDDEGGSILSVAYDPWGIAFVYTGFILFTLAGGWLLMRKFIRPRKLVGNQKISKGLALAMGLMAACGAFEASALPAISKDKADSLAYKQVVFNGEVVSFNTVATRLTHKLTGSGEVAGLSPEGFVASLIQFRDDWVSVPFLKIKSRKLREALQIKGEYAALTDLYDDKERYLPGVLYEGGGGKMDNDILALDEKVALLIDLWSGKLIMPIETSPSGRASENSAHPIMRSEISIRSEVAYNKLMPVRVLFMGSMSLAVYLLLSMIARLKTSIKFWILIALLSVFGCVCFIWHCMISANFPLGTTYEMMEFTGVIVLMTAAYVSWKGESQLLVVLALFGGAFLFLVSWLGYNDPVMTPVMPVLASPWLSVHVSLVMAAYAILGFTLPVAMLALFLPSQRERLTTLSFSLLSPGVYLLGLGIIVGAMWANVSWGRYWAWDPKETWALVTMLFYAIPLHRHLGLRKSPCFYNVYIVLIFTAILMTYFGVNYLPSLHAYR